MRIELDGLFERVNNHLNNGNDYHIGRQEVARQVGEVRRGYQKEIRTVTECVERLIERVESGEKERQGHWGRVWSNWGPPILAAVVALTVALANRLWQ